MSERIGEHPLWHWPVFGTVHADTIIMTWIVMLVALAFFAWIGSSYKHPGARVTKAQSTFEGIVEYLADLSVSTLGPSGEPFVPFFIALFIFIFLLNQVGFLPFKLLGLPFGGSPTADLNTTFAYAVIVFVMIYVVGIARKGVRGFFGHFLQPFWILFPINLLEDLARPITLALRLFFNIFVGEILLVVLATIIAARVHIGGFDLSLAAAVVPFFIEFFNFFIGTLQAFVFTLLTIVYLSTAVSGESH